MSDLNISVWEVFLESCVQRWRYLLLKLDRYIKDCFATKSHRAGNLPNLLKKHITLFLYQTHAELPTEIHAYPKRKNLGRQ